MYRITIITAGESFVSLHQQYRTGRSSVSKIVKTTTEAIYREFKHDYLKVGSGYWTLVLNSMDQRYDVPHIFIRVCVMCIWI